MVLIATPALANYVARRSFDRQVVAADAFVIVRATGDRKPCPGEDPNGWPMGVCTTVQVLNALKGDPGETFSFQVEGPISETDPDCCAAGAIYAIAAQRLFGGTWAPVNGGWGVYALRGPWADSRPAAEPTPWPQGRRRLSFDQKVVEADHVVIAVATGEPGPCPGENMYSDEECASLTVIQTLKGEVPATFPMRISTRSFNLGTRKTTVESHGCCEVGQIYFLALSGSYNGVFYPVNGADSVQRLVAPTP